jgi:hypothetical protein
MPAPFEGPALGWDAHHGQVMCDGRPVCTARRCGRTCVPTLEAGLLWARDAALMKGSLSGLSAEVSDEIRDSVRRLRVIVRQLFQQDIRAGTAEAVSELLCQQRDDFRLPVSGDGPLHDMDGALFLPLDEALKTLANSGPVRSSDIDAPDHSATVRVTRSHKTVAEANAIAKALVGSLGGAMFFGASESAQARKIGCHLNTWRKTELYKAAKKQGKIKKRKSSQLLTAVKLSDAILASNGNVQRKDRLHKERDSELNKLIAEQERDYEPSPLGDPGKKRLRSCRKTV